MKVMLMHIVFMYDTDRGEMEILTAQKRKRRKLYYLFAISLGLKLKSNNKSCLELLVLAKHNVLLNRLLFTSPLVIF